MNCCREAESFYLARGPQATLRKQLAEYKIFSDIIVHSHSEVEDKKEIFGHIVRDIISEGITL